MNLKPNLIVIEGDSQGRSPWLNVPPTVAAQSPYNSDLTIMHRIATGDVVKAARNCRRQPIFDLWSMVIGQPPPVPGVQDSGEELTCLTDAHACFRGIQRPRAEDNDGSNVIIYVLRPSVFYVHDPNMRTVAQLRELPRNLVFTVFVRMDEPFALGAGDTGIVTHWQFVEAEIVGSIFLPQNAGTRYEERLW